MKKKRAKSPIFLEKYWEIIPGTHVRFDFPRVHQNNKKAYASAPFVILRDLIKGVERSEQNNPVSCFANGDRRFLRDVTSKNPKRRAKIKNDSLSKAL